jgi:hypothetical protein
MTFDNRLRAIVDDISLPSNFRIILEKDKIISEGRFYFQIGCMRPDTYTGVLKEGYSGKVYLSEYASDSELVQCIFGLYKAYVEHEVRETFLWRGRRVFGPHISTEALWEIADRTDSRKRKTNELH